MSCAQNCSLLDPSKKVMIFDGCFRSELKIRKQTLTNIQNYSRLRFNRTQEKLVRGVHMDFLNAGATVIRTNTYWASESFMKKYYQNPIYECVDTIENGVLRAQEAVETFTKGKQQHSEKKYFILGSCGSATNTKGIKINELDQNKIIDFHRLRVQTLVKAKVDALAFESIETVEEAYALVELMREFPDTKVWMTFRNGYPSWLNTMKGGGNILDVAQYCCDSLQSQIIAIGVNCVNIADVKDYLLQVNENRNMINGIPVVVCPKVVTLNKRLAALPNPIESIKRLDFVKTYPVKKWPEMGASYIGGCCNMLSQDIYSISSIITGYHQLYTD